ncbi:hypothetical protein RvY_08779-2 [Ramazzottius varieornatus]|uniref:Fibronectin type-III domain-containing protein n=1 Tax=Ramazzottius varieornatus TaxID=947166 RepID=A0A1D1VCN3_RAMVA|nr:hypothetical protein RvY_08779-2 [Ramazzottius varieornatus]
MRILGLPDCFRLNSRRWSILALQLYGCATVLGVIVPNLRLQSEVRSVSLQWDPDSTNDSSPSFVVTYCEDSPWDDEPRLCKLFQTNETRVRIDELRPSTKYLFQVEKLVEEPNSGREGRILLPADPLVNVPTTFNFRDRQINWDKASASSIETKKYAVRNVDCRKGEAEVTIETGEGFEGVIAVQRASGQSQAHCSVRGQGLAASQPTYVLSINYTTCEVHFRQNGTIMEAIVMIQEHASVVMGTDRSFRISCNYLPATIRLETGMGGGSRVIQMADQDGPSDPLEDDDLSVEGLTGKDTSKVPGQGVPVRRPAVGILQDLTRSIRTTRTPKAVSGSDDPADDRGAILYTAQLRRPRLQTAAPLGDGQFGYEPSNPSTEEPYKDFYAGRQSPVAGGRDAENRKESVESSNKGPESVLDMNLNLDIRPADVQRFSSQLTSSGNDQPQTAVLLNLSPGPSHLSDRETSGTREEVGAVTASTPSSAILTPGSRSHPSNHYLLDANLQNRNVNSNASGPRWPVTADDLTPLQITAISASCSVVALVIAVLLLWLLLCRGTCSYESTRKRKSKRRAQLLDQQRFG